MPRLSRLERPMPAYLWNPETWQKYRPVQRMTWQQRGLFRELLDESYLRDGLPADPAEIAHLLAEPVAGIETDLGVVLACFTVGADGKLRHEWIESERERQNAYRQSRIHVPHMRAHAHTCPQVTAPYHELEVEVEVKENLNQNQNPSDSLPLAGGDSPDLFPQKESKKPKPPDPRHGPTRSLIQEQYKAKFQIEAPWDGSEARALGFLLNANPKWTQADLDRMIRARFQSEGVNGDRPRLWLPHLGKYAGGPLDRFDKPQAAAKPARTSRHIGFENIDYTAGLKKNQDGSYRLRALKQIFLNARSELQTASRTEHTANTSPEATRVVSSPTGQVAQNAAKKRIGLTSIVATEKSELKPAHSMEHTSRRAAFGKRST